MFYLLAVDRSVSLSPALVVLIEFKVFQPLWVLKVIQRLGLSHTPNIVWPVSDGVWALLLFLQTLRTPTAVGISYGDPSSRKNVDCCFA